MTMMTSVTESTPSTISPSIQESLLAPETDDTYESSILQASPLVQPVAFPEGPDIFFNISFMCPTASAYTSQEQRQLIMVVKSLSSEFPPPITYSLSMTRSTLPAALSAPPHANDTSENLGHLTNTYMLCSLHSITGYSHGSRPLERS